MLLLIWSTQASASPFAYITNTCSGTVTVVDTANDAVLGPPISVGNSPIGAVVNPTGTKVYITNSGDSTVSVIDATSNTVTATISVGPAPLGIAINPAGTRVYVGNNGGGINPNNTVSVIDTASNTVIATITVGFSPSGLAVNPAGTRLYVANTPESTLSVIDTSNNSVITTVSLNGSNAASGVVVNPSGTRVYVAAPDANLVHVLDTTTNTVIAEVSVPGKAAGIALTPDGTRLYAALSFNADTVAVVDTSTNSLMTTIPVSGDAGSVAVTPDGTRAYVTMGPNNISVIDTATNTVVDTVSVSCPDSFGSGFIGPSSVPPQIGLPILFVHGFCGDVTGGDDLLKQLKTNLNSLYPKLFPNKITYVTFYDGSVVNFQIQDSPILLSHVNPGARFFEVALFDPTASPAIYQHFDLLEVARVPIFQKGNELAHIIWNIKAITGAPRVMVVGHSMGGLDARAYIEQLAVPSIGSSETTFENDISTLVTLDTPHAGASILTNILASLSSPLLKCLFFDTINKRELTPQSITLRQLNYEIRGGISLPFGLTIYPIKSYYTMPCCPFWFDLFGRGRGSDNILLKAEQDLAANIPPGHSLSQINTVENNHFVPNRVCGNGLPFVSDPLHVMNCVGDSTTLNIIQSELLPLITMPNNITVTPSAVRLSPGANQDFHASNTVTWSIREGQPCGKITTSGIYTAPSTQGVCHVVGIYETGNSYGEATITVQ